MVVILNDRVVIFQVGSLHENLVMKRSTQPTAPVQELVVVTCCAPITDNTDPKYRNQSTALMVNVQLQPPTNINWTATAGACLFFVMPPHLI